MEKKFIISSLIGLLSISSFVGCDSNVSSSNQITSSSNNGLTTEKARINEMIESLRNGIAFEGEIVQKRHILDGYFGNKTGNVEVVEFNAEYIFEMSNENGYSSIVTIDEGNGEELIINNQVFEGEDGYAYFYDLNYDNTVDKYPIMDIQTGAKVNFGYYCLNPFDYLLAEDFIKVSENTYTLNKGKAAFFAANIFGQVDPAFNRVIDTCEFILEGSTLKSFKFVPQETHNQYTDYEELKAIYYYAENIATFDVTKIGAQAIVPKPQPKETKEEHAALQNAFSKFENKNFTSYLYIDYVDGYGDKLGENHLYYYYDGEALYFSATEDQSEPDSINDMYLKPNANGLISIDGTYVTYDQIVPKISEVSAAIFNYNSEKDVYSICDELVGYIGYIALVPPITEFSLYLMDYGTGMEVFLNDNDELDRIEFSYLYHDGFNYDDGKVVMKFSNVGTTVLPHNLVPVV